MTDTEIIEAQIEEPHELVKVEGPPPSLFGTQDPREALELATAKAKAAADVIRQRKLVAKISGREHVLVEGWTTLGSLLGVFPVTAWTQPIANDEGTVMGFRARVEARTMSGQIVGAAESRCMRSERNWRGRDEYALESMAQTRATSKALRQAVGFVMVLAGYNPTPAEELEDPATGGTAEPPQGSAPPLPAAETGGEDVPSSGGEAEGGSGTSPPASFNRDVQVERAQSLFGSKVKLLKAAGAPTLDAITNEKLAELIKERMANK